MKLQKKLTVLLSVSMLIHLLVSPRAFAGPDLPVVVGPEADFTGNQSGGVRSGFDFSCPPIYTLNVYDLTTNIGPVANDAGIAIVREAGDGTVGTESRTAFNAHGGNGGPGGLGGEVIGLTLVGPTVNFTGGEFEIFSSGILAGGIYAQSAGGNGGAGGYANSVFASAWGGAGGSGGGGMPVTVTSNGGIHASGGFFSMGIWATSAGGNGGAGGATDAAIAATGGAGGAGGLGRAVTVANQDHVQTGGVFSVGILATSTGGDGGVGGSAHTGGNAYGGQGGAGGDGGTVIVTNDGSIQAEGIFTFGIAAGSGGGTGGDGGFGNSVLSYGKGGDGGPGGTAGPVEIDNHGAITIISTMDENQTNGFTAGILGQSLGGIGGNGGSGSSIVGVGGSAQGGGSAGTVDIENTGTITATGLATRGILAQSIGGFGGGGGTGAGVVGWGGSGTSSGNGALVTVENSGTITATGDGSRSIWAQSIGGGGGDAGYASAGVAIGGTGAAAGNGGKVTVTNTGPLQTSGTDALGLLAQSVGGGGGSGSGSDALVSIGGDGGSNGDGGLVIVENTGDITTVGDGSASIFAQSIGGGGGVVGGHGGTSNSPFFSMGGNGASGGSGERVTVNNSGNLTTSGIDSSGIFAQSVGGGGGAGGGTYDVGLFFAYSMGGSSTLGGDGGQVDVDSVDSSIITSGTFSHGIHAQSLGGGGGSGGNAYHLILGLALSESLAIGGDAGGGGNGGAVNLTNSSTITTLGEQAHGLYAQSVGGGGGNGGNVSNWTVNLDVPMVDIPDISIAFSLGGEGGAGGDGRAVTLDNMGDINTSGFRSYGIFAQSVGGGGGDGGRSMSGVVAINSMGFSMAIGGNGSEGGNGGTVDVTNSGNITTQGDFAYGILGQSIGGGGGAGGNSTALIADIEVLMDWEDLLAPDANFKLSLGGTSGGGGDGEHVDIINTGNIVTNGNFANGIQAQSIGGGGGAGAEVTSIQVELSGNPLDYIPFFSFLSADINLLIGSDGGDGGKGGEVEVTNNDNISTGGNFANGILAQSVGGGGGTAGYIHDESYRLTSPTMATVLGGSEGGAGGNGDKVDVTNNENTTISTEGDFANGILAQSIGGGGGSGGHLVDTTVPPDLEPITPLLDKFFISSKFSIGGRSGVGGNGGEVNVTNKGNISTKGNFSNGILAQSIGGGGGAGGYIHVDPDGSTDSASVMVFEGSNGGGGNGGDVTVVNNGDITTDGGFAHGILAQSIGGGGGFGGISEDGGISTLDFDSTANGIFAENTGFGVGFAGSAGGSGSAGAVSVAHTGSITTLGDMSHGILAQSAAGSGTAGTVTVTLASEIMADGVDSDGIHAQSIGGSGNGDIAIDIGGGTVRGGSGAGAGVNIDGGFNNTLINAGNISALSGMAIIGGVGNETVNNNGIVTGSVDLSTGINAFYNNPGATFNAGALVNLGAGNALTNAGVFSPGGSGTVLNTTLIGDLVQLASGLMEIEIGGFTPGTFDFIDITGTADLTGGNINFSFLSGYDIVTDVGPGENWELTFLSADSIESFNSVINYNFMGLPYFQYDVFQRDNDLIFQATNTVPLPGAFLLGCIGLGCIQVVLRRRRPSTPQP